MQRRIGFLHDILTRPDSSLLKSFFNAQKTNPVKDDWVHTIRGNLEEAKINLSFEEISKLKKKIFLKLSKTKIKQHALEYLNNIKISHSKMDGLSYDKLEMKPYLKSQKLFVKEATNIFKFRTRMSDVKMNFSSQYVNLNCSLGCDEFESQEHLINCDKIESNLDNNDVDYEDLFSNNILKLKNIAKKLSSALEAKNKIIEG